MKTPAPAVMGMPCSNHSATIIEMMITLAPRTNPHRRSSTERTSCRARGALVCGKRQHERLRSKPTEHGVAEHHADQQRTHPAAVIGHAEQAQQPVEAGCAPAAERHIDPILHRAGQRRRGLEHREQDRKEHDDADYGVQQHAVDAVEQGDMTVVVDLEATQYAGGPVKAGIGP